MLLAILTAAMLLVRSCASEPTPQRPVVLPGPDDAGRIVDLLKAPNTIELRSATATYRIPGQPLRYLHVRLGRGTLSLGWASAPDEEPAERLEVPAHGSRLEAYVDLHAPGRAVIEAWNGFAESGRTPFELAFTHD